jgi:hypothetical protein
MMAMPSGSEDEDCGRRDWQGMAYDEWNLFGAAFKRRYATRGMAGTLTGG